MSPSDLQFVGIETIIDDQRWRAAMEDPEGLTGSCLGAISAREPRAAAGGFAVLLTDDAALRELNARFRGLDKPTNVLAFPAGEEGSAFLGDVAVAYETCQAEAAARGVQMAEHAAHLIVHGVLHLLGYDHQNDDEAMRMETLESQIVSAMGYADPYADGGAIAVSEKGDAPA